MNNHSYSLQRPFPAAVIALTIACGIGPALMAHAQPPMGGPMTFGAFDQDGDGAVTEQEFYDARAQRMRERAQQGYPMRNAANAPPFESVDGDGNGVVSPDEFAAAQAEHRRQMMQPR